MMTNQTSHQAGQAPGLVLFLSEHATQVRRGLEAYLAASLARISHCGLRAESR